MLNQQKIMMLGDVGVGKSSLVRRLVLDRFDADYKATLGVDISVYDMPLADGGAVTLALWDVDGDLRESAYKMNYIGGASGALIVGDMRRRATQETMRATAELFRAKRGDRPLFFVLNKADLVPNAESAPIPDELSNWRHAVRKTSAKTGFNVRAAFQQLAAMAARLEP